MVEERQFFIGGAVCRYGRPQYIFNAFQGCVERNIAEIAQFIKNPAFETQRLRDQTNKLPNCQTVDIGSRIICGIEATDYVAGFTGNAGERPLQDNGQIDVVVALGVKFGAIN